MSEIQEIIKSIQNLLSKLSIECQLNEKTLNEIKQIQTIMQNYKELCRDVKCVQPEDIFNLDKDNELWKSVLIVSPLGELKI